MRIANRFVACLALLSLAACTAQRTPLSVPTTTVQPISTVASSQTAYPTYTPQATYTPNATYTPLSSLTPAATIVVTQVVEVIVTGTPSPTPVNSPTITPTPSRTLEPSATLRPTSTPRPTATPRPTRTATATSFEDQYADVDVRELDKNASSHLGEAYVLKGQVFTIEEDTGGTFLQMWVRYPGGNDFNRIAVVVLYGQKLPNVFENTRIIVYGRVVGTFSGTNAYGGTITQPELAADVIKLQ